MRLEYGVLMLISRYLISSDAQVRILQVSISFFFYVMNLLTFCLLFLFNLLLYFNYFTSVIRTCDNVPKMAMGIPCDVL